MAPVESATMHATMHAASGGRGQPARSPRWGHRLALVFLLAFGLRLLGNVAFEALDSGPNARAFYDGVEFDSGAVHLVEQGRYVIDPDGLASFRAPGFPFLIAGVYWLFGAGNHVAAHVMFCLIGALLTLATWKLALEITDEATALLASLIVAVYPNLLYWCLHFSSEPLYTLLLTTSLWLLLRGLRRESLADQSLAGFLLGYAVLTRPLAVYFVPCLALMVLVAARHRPRFALAGALLFFVGAAVPVAPWTVRNGFVHDRFVLIATNGGSTFWGATNQLVLDDESLRGGWVTTSAMPEQKAQVTALPGEVERDKLEWQLGMQFLAENPMALPRLLAYRFLAFWTPFSRTPNALFNWVVGLSYGLLLPFMLLGLLRLTREKSPATRGINASTARTGASALVLTVLLTLAGSLVFYGSGRFRSVIEPLLLILAASALLQTARRARALLPRGPLHLPSVRVQSPLAPRAPRTQSPQRSQHPARTPAEDGPTDSMPRA